MIELNAKLNKSCKIINQTQSVAKKSVMPNFETIFDVTNNNVFESFIIKLLHYILRRLPLLIHIIHYIQIS